MPPPPAEPLAARIFLGPALRTQPDRRLVKLVREGYETAFDEIVRRYRTPLDRFAAAIVGSRSEDVTQDAFSKALQALRGTTTEIELKPWLFRIVRNTALNDLRDGPPPAEELGEAVAGGRSAAEVAEGREEIGELMERLRALPEPQRAAIVMRELEGLSHEEIAAALGVSGGAARQAIYRARVALRDGLGLLVPLPLLRVLFDHGAEAAGASAGGLAAAGAAASGGGSAALGGFGAGAALKVGVATALVAGSVGAGVAIQHERDGRGGPTPAEAAAVGAPGEEGADASGSQRPAAASTAALVSENRERGHGRDGQGDDNDAREDHGANGGHRGGGGKGSGEDSDRGGADDRGDDRSEHHGGRHRGPSSGRGPGASGRGPSGHDDDHPGESSGGKHSGQGGSSGSGSGKSGESSGRDSGSGHGSSGRGHDDDLQETGLTTTTAAPPPSASISDDAEDSGHGSESESSGSGGGPGNSGSGSDEIDP